MMKKKMHLTPVYVAGLSAMDSEKHEDVVVEIKRAMEAKELSFATKREVKEYMVWLASTSFPVTADDIE